MENQRYTPEFRSAVMAALLTGQSIASTAREYKMPYATVHAWNRKTQELVGNADDSDTKKRVGDALIEYLEEALKTLKIQVKAFSDVTWLHKQPASEVAVLHGVIADKTIRLLEALAPDGEESEPPLSTEGSSEEVAE